MGKYIAIIADIKKSRSLPNRSAAQEKIKKTLSIINEKYSAVIAAKFFIRSGYSFQCLLKNGSQIMNIIMDLDLELYPIKIRYGIGIGSIDTIIDVEDSNLSDGQAYHIARSSIEKANKLEGSKGKIVTNFIISKEDDELLLINSLLSLLSILKNNWTKNQVKVIKNYIENNYEQMLTANKLDKAQSTISRSLEKSNFYSIKNAVDILNISIENERIK